MPELPDIAVYLAALARRVAGRRLLGVRVASPFLLRTFDPPLESAANRVVERLRRIGKRIAFGLEGDLWLVLHLMIAGRLHWKPPRAALAGKSALATFDFEHGSLVLTEAGHKRRAGLWVVAGEAALAEHDPGGIDPLAASEAEFAAAITRENHTLKRALTDPTILSGVGNAYSDEILHRARLSPLALTQKLPPESVSTLWRAARDVLVEWTDRLATEAGDDFPEGVTAFRPEMAVHGRFGRPCPACGSPVQRIRYAENETNYCARCQTGGKVLADRSLSRLMKDDWPRKLADWE